MGCLKSKMDYFYYIKFKLQLSYANKYLLQTCLKIKIKMKNVKNVDGEKLINKISKDYVAVRKCIQSLTLVMYTFSKTFILFNETLNQQPTDTICFYQPFLPHPINLGIVYRPQTRFLLIPTFI